jgi:CMP-N-acetylneuraminic acid synthetase
VTLPAVALVPAKGASRRVPDKNARPFYNGLSLVEWKVETLRASGVFDAVFVSSDDAATLERVAARGAEPLPRDPRLCADDCPVGDVIAGVAAQVLERIGRGHANAPLSSDAFLFWAHPTSPFVRAETIARAVAEARARPDACVVGRERLHDFLWTDDGPLNYDPERQPRSQDLPPVYRITGGVHVGRAALLVARRSHTFAPRHFLDLDRPESLDVNTPDDWNLCAALAPSLLSPSLPSDTDAEK